MAPLVPWRVSSSRLTGPSLRVQTVLLRAVAGETRRALIFCVARTTVVLQDVPDEISARCGATTRATA
eukprot:2694696-Pyramimonas_sp.AAC.1